jgi:hypothetical protein
LYSENVPCCPGIYRLLDTEAGKCYVGQASNLNKRRGYHWQELRGNRHRNRYLQAAWNKRSQAFVFEVLEVVEDGEDLVRRLIEREQFWIDRWFSCFLFNLAPVAGSLLGSKRNAESRAKIGAASRGKKRAPRTAEHCANLAAALRGKKLSVDHCAKMSASRKGFKFSQESCARMSAARKGVRMSEAARANMSAARRGMKFSDEHRANLSKAHKGKKRAPLSAEHRAKLSVAAKARWTPEERTRQSVVSAGRKFSLESRAKMSESARYRRRSGK